MASKQGFDALKQDYPVFQIENKTNVSKILDLIGDDDVIIPPNSIVDIDASKLYQLPNSTIFKLKYPKVSTLIEYGLIKTAEAPKTDAPKPSDQTSDTNGAEKKK